MSICTESTRAVLAGVDARRARRELVLEGIFRPLTSLLVPVFVRLRVPPPAVVVANAVVGLLAALALVANALLVAAVLLQVKTLLDNTDGRLARDTGRVTLTGRYLDTVADLVVNVALFAALGQATGQPVLALVALVALTILLSVDFNVSELAREAHGIASAPILLTGTRSERVFALVYRGVFAPQDRLVRGLSERRLERAVGRPVPDAVRRAYFDALTLTALANVGLTTQLVALGILLVLGVPGLYLWLVLACAALLAPLQLRRERLARRAAIAVATRRPEA